MSEIADFFSEQGLLSKAIPNFEVRPQQIQMAEAVMSTLENKKSLAVEAGTGVGKSLAYLLPIFIYCRKERKRAAISTYTKILQNQLLKNDIPIIKSVLNETISVEVVYGQENYLCKRRLNILSDYGLLDTKEEVASLQDIFNWSKTSSGILLEYPKTISPKIRERIGRDADNCQYAKCQFHSACSYFRAKKRFEAANILILNHYLLFANAANDYHLLPKFNLLILDEAHRLEEVCAQFFGIEISNFALSRLLSRIFNPRNRKGILPFLLLSDSQRARIERQIFEILETAELFWTNLKMALSRRVRDEAKQQEFKKRIKSPNLVENILAKPLLKLSASLRELIEQEANPDLVGELRSINKRLSELTIGIDSFLSLSDENSVYWIEFGPKNRMVLATALIDVQEVFQTKVINKYDSVIMTSATLTVNRDFSFFLSRLGADGFPTILLDSPFDYKNQALLFIGNYLPLPTEETKFYPSCAEAIEKLIKISQGRALVLFTSYKALKEVYNRIPSQRFPFYIQTDGPNFELLENFKRDISSVLFATQSFWQGIDVPGPTLSCLVITRLPFDVPLDPRLEGIAESLKEKGLDPFWTFQLPNAVLKFRQGFGRLIRNKKDYGVVSVLDKRIVFRNYGRLFLTSLPKNLKVVDNLKAVSQFFNLREKCRKIVTKNV